jgi:ribosomal protein L24
MDIGGASDTMPGGDAPADGGAGEFALGDIVEVLTGERKGMAGKATCILAASGRGPVTPVDGQPPGTVPLDVSQLQKYNDARLCQEHSQQHNSKTATGKDWSDEEYWSDEGQDVFEVGDIIEVTNGHYKGKVTRIETTNNIASVLLLDHDAVTLRLYTAVLEHYKNAHMVGGYQSEQEGSVKEPAPCWGTKASRTKRAPKRAAAAKQAQQQQQQPRASCAQKEAQRSPRRRSGAQKAAGATAGPAACGKVTEELSGLADRLARGSEEFARGCSNLIDAERMLAAVQLHSGGNGGGGGGGGGGLAAHRPRGSSDVSEHGRAKRVTAEQRGAAGGAGPRERLPTRDGPFPQAASQWQLGTWKPRAGSERY